MASLRSNRESNIARDIATYRLNWPGADTVYKLQYPLIVDVFVCPLCQQPESRELETLLKQN